MTKETKRIVSDSFWEGFRIFRAPNPKRKSSRPYRQDEDCFKMFNEHKWFSFGEKIGWKVLDLLTGTTTKTYFV
jgi:hypothetical protein